MDVQLEYNMTLDLCVLVWLNSVRLLKVKAVVCSIMWFICSLPHWVLPVDLWLLMEFWGNCIKHFLLQPKPQWSDFRWSRSPGGGTATKHVTEGAEVCWEVLRTPCKVNWSLVYIHVHSFRVSTIESVVYNGVHVEWIMLNLYLVEVLNLVG